MLKKWIDKINEWYKIVNELYNRYRRVILFLIIAAIFFESVDKLQKLRRYYTNQESFDLNEVPFGVVVWIYPKDKTQHALQPDSLKIRNLSDDIISLNYNVNVWVVAIHTSHDELVKIEVPDYAISYFSIGKIVGRSEVSK